MTSMTGNNYIHGSKMQALSPYGVEVVNLELAMSIVDLVCRNSSRAYT